MERLTMSAIACGFARVCLDDALAWRASAAPSASF